MHLALLFESFARRGMRYAVLRNFDMLPESTGGSDLDLLVQHGSASALRSSIADLVAATDGCIFGSFRSGPYRKFGLLAFDADSRAWDGVVVDAFEGVHFKGAAPLLTADPDAVSFMHGNGFRALERFIAAPLAVLKELLHRETLPARYAEEARYAFRSHPVELAAALSPIGPSALAILRDICLHTPDRAVLRREARRLRRAVLRHALARDPLRYAIGRIRHTLSRLQRYASPPGLMLAVIGTDGVGKSTLIDAITPVLRDATHGALHRRHLRPGLLPPLGRLRGAAGPDGPVTDPHGRAQSGRLGSILRLAWLWIDYVLGYWLVVRPKIARGPVIVVFDRYVHDLVLDPKRFRIALPDSLLTRIVRLVPRPDLTICLHGDPDAIAARKRELPLDEVRRQIAALHVLAARDPSFVLVSTDGSVEESRNAVLNALRRHLDRQPSRGLT